MSTLPGDDALRDAGLTRTHLEDAVDLDPPADGAGTTPAPARRGTVPTPREIAERRAARSPGSPGTAPPGGTVGA